MIHTYTQHGYHIVLDTYSGAIHLVDEPTFWAIEMMNTPAFDRSNPDSLASLRSSLQDRFSCSAQDAQEILQEVQQLIEDNVLFSEDPYAQLSIDLQKRPTFVKALCLNVAHTCNLDCDYCFASQGKYHGKRALMSFDVAKKAIDFLIAHSGHHHNLDIDFFGGEPSLNYDVVQKTMDYARSLEKEHNKHFRFTFTTNGMLLDEPLRSSINEQMDNIVLSMDGRKEVHDHFRHTIQKEGSYETIVPKFQKLVQDRKDREYYMRGTYTARNLDFASDVIHMANLGFYRLSMEPVIGDPNEPYMLNESHIPTLHEQYDQLCEEMIRRLECAAQAKAKGQSIDALPPEDHPFLFYHFMMNLEHGPCVYKRISGCGSGTEYMAVTPTGELYPCHQFIGDPDYQIGTLDDPQLDDALISQFKSCNVYAHPACANCWAKLYCAGGCAANALHASGDLQGVVPLSCALFKKRVECAIAIKAAEADLGVQTPTQSGLSLS